MNTPTWARVAGICIAIAGALAIAMFSFYALLMITAPRM